MLSDDNAKSEIHAAFKKLVDRAVVEFAKHDHRRDHILIVENALLKTKEMKKLIKLLREAVSDTRQLEVMTGEKMDLALSEALSRYVHECFAAQGPPEVDKNKLEQIYREFDWCTSVKIPLGRFWGYVQQCEIDRRVIDLDGPLRLRKATIIEKAYFKSQGFAVGGRTESNVIVETMPSARTSEISRSPGRIQQVIKGEMLVEFDYLVTTLRLVHPSSVGVNLIMHDESPQKRSFVFSITHNTRPDIFPAAFSRRRDTRCILNKSRTKLLLKLIRKIRKAVKMDLPEVERLLRSLRRYNRAISDDFIEDEVIDLSIILETIVREGGSRMASQIAQIAATSDEEREWVTRVLKKVHRSVRSSLVHGASFEPKHKSLVDDLFKITCRALRSYIILIGIRGGITKHIDSVMTNRAARVRLDRKLANWIDDASP